MVEDLRQTKFVGYEPTGFPHSCVVKRVHVSNRHHTESTMGKYPVQGERSRFEEQAGALWIC